MISFSYSKTGVTFSIFLDRQCGRHRCGHLGAHQARCYGAFRVSISRGDGTVALGRAKCGSKRSHSPLQ